MALRTRQARILIGFIARVGEVGDRLIGDREHDDLLRFLDIDLRSINATEGERSEARQELSRTIQEHNKVVSGSPHQDVPIAAVKKVVVAIGDGIKKGAGTFATVLIVLGVAIIIGSLAGILRR